MTKDDKVIPLVGPLCIDCLHHKVLGVHKCTRLRKRVLSLVTGAPVETGRLLSCEEERSTTYACGSKGKYFEPKDQKAEVIQSGK